MTQEPKKRGRPAGAGPITGREINLIKRGIVAGLTPSQIAKAIGRGRATVYRTIQNMDAQLPLDLGPMPGECK